MTTLASDVCRWIADLVKGDHSRKHGEALAARIDISASWPEFSSMPIAVRDAALMVAPLKGARTRTSAFRPDNDVDNGGSATIAADAAG